MRVSTDSPPLKTNATVPAMTPSSGEDSLDLLRKISSNMQSDYTRMFYINHFLSLILLYSYSFRSLLLLSLQRDKILWGKCQSNGYKIIEGKFNEQINSSKVITALIRTVQDRNQLRNRDFIGQMLW